MTSLNNIISKLNFVTDADLQTTLSQLYHENSKASRFNAIYNPASKGAGTELESLLKMVAGKGKSYRHCPTVDLSREETREAEDTFPKTIAGRRTCRAFSAKDLEFSTFSELLKISAGTNGSAQFADGTPLPLRSYPSAGGLFPLEVYALINNVAGIEPGVYHYDPFQHALMRIQAGISEQSLLDIFMDDPIAAEAGAVLTLTAVMPRVRIKYGEKGYRYALIETGHLAQNILLAATYLGLGSAPIGGFFERGLERLLDIDGIEEIALYSILIGNK